MNRRLIRGLSCVFAMLMSISICATCIGQAQEGFINEFFGIQSGTTSSASTDTYVYKSAYTEDGIPSDEGMAKLLAAEDAFNKEAMEESAVLLYNNGALPFSSDVKNITLLGRAAADPIYRNHSAGPTVSSDDLRRVDLAMAMENAGFSINRAMLDAYSASTTPKRSNTFVGEEPISFYSDDLTSTFSSYGDAAIIMFARSAGEGSDAAPVDESGISLLALHEEEAALLKLAKSYKDSGVFKSIVVLINSANAMELDWVHDEQYGVDALLWIGNPGLNGFAGIPSLLKGEVSPSGHLVDTFATDSLSSAAAQNLGNNTFGNSDQALAVYAENIYVGYKYYETRYEDLILNRYNASSTAGVFASTDAWNYADEMAFPFGFGLSYTTFQQKLDSVEWNKDGTITVKVTVTNTGDMAGKSVVQVYAQSPYTQYDIEHKVEKSAIQLLDFGKTRLLQPQESETLEIVADRYLIASWDSTAHDGKGGYILDDGDYYIAIGDNVHDALNNILAAKNAKGMYDELGNAVEGDAAKAALHVLEEFDDETYRYNETGTAIENQFVGDIYATDYNAFNTGDTVTYMTRSDWTTFPRTYDDLTYTDRMEQLHSGDFYEELKAIVGTPEKYTLEQPAGILFVDMVDVPWDDDAKWNQFLSQLTVRELALIVADGWGQKAVPSISKPQNYQFDGPDGSNTNYRYGDKVEGTTYVNEGTMACSWSKDIIRRRGEFLAEDALYANTSCAMAPGVDIHRTPFSGRTFEYYSEDGVMAYLLGSVQCKAMQEKGIVSMLKHIAGNDQETNRSGLCEFMTEQTLRESSLKGFEGCMRVGGAQAAMAGMNALGVVDNAKNYALLTKVVRDEWNWTGIINTDANVGDTPALRIVSGIDEFCMNATINTEVMRLANQDEYLLAALMKTNKRFYYTYAHSTLINGLTRSTTTSDDMAWWQTTLIAMDVVFGVLTVVCIGLTVFLMATKNEKLSIKKKNARRGNGNE